MEKEANEGGFGGETSVCCNSSGDSSNNNIDDVVEYYLNYVPPGYRFKPTDYELVVHYLQNKNLRNPVFINRIRDLNLYLYHPQQLIAEMYNVDGEEEWYFFTPKDRKYPWGSRAAKNGYWRASIADTSIKSRKDGKIVGYKRALVFYDGAGEKTNWTMHEYRLKQQTNTCSRSRYKIRVPGDIKSDDWVLCKLQKKKTVVNNQRQDDNCGGLEDID